MAVINSKEENDFLMSLLDDSPYDQAYFGLRKNEQNNWEWPNGSTEPYRNWTSGTENSNRGSYAMLSTDNPDGTWGQGDFIETDGGTAFFCEWEGAFDLPIEENSGSTDPVTVFSEALAKFDGADISITKEGSFLADFVNFSELRFTQKMDIQKFGQPTMTASGHYTSTGGSGTGTSEMDYDFTYDSQGMHIPDYEQQVTGELVTLELPPLECVHSYSETERDGGGKIYLVTYNGEALTQENCGIFSSVLNASFRVYWSPSEEYADEDGIQKAEVLFSTDNEGNLVSIEVSYQMYAGIQGIAPVEGTTTFTFNEILSTDKIDITNYFGTWEADPNVTMELTGKSLMSIYGSGISNGSELVIGEDGFFSFYIGITQDNQGEGTWEWNRNGFDYTLTSFMNQTEVRGHLTIEPYNGEDYLVMNDRGKKVYWKRSDQNTRWNQSLSYQMHTESFDFPLSDGRLYYSNELTYPYFQGTFDVVNTINQHYSEIVDGYRYNDTDYDQIYQEALQWNQNVDEGIPYYDHLETEVTLFDINGAVAIKETYTMWSGGAHPYHEVKGINFDVTSGQMLTYEDILQGTSEQVDAVLRKYFIEAVPWNQGANDGTVSMTEILKYTSYTLTESGLCFYYNVGDAEGRQEITIPYTTTDSYLISAEELLSSSTSN